MASTATFTSCKDYDDDIDQVNTNINAVKSDLSSKMDAVNTSISGLTSAQSEIKGSLSAVNKQIETLSADGAKAVAALKAELQKADADQKAAIEAQIAELGTKLEEQIDALNVQAAQLAAQQAQIEGILAELEATKAGIEAANAKLDKAEAELKAGIAANTQSIEELNKQLAEKLAEITEAFNAKIDTELAAVQGEIAALVTVQTNQQGSINNILVELEAISGSLAGNTAAVETLKADIETLKQEMEEKIVASHDKIRDEIAAVDAKLAAEIDLVKNDLAALALNLAEQKTELELQKVTLEAYKATLEAADIDLDGKIADNAEAIAANKEAADKAIADLEVLLNQKVEELGGKIEEIVANHEALKVIVGSLQGDVEEINGDIEDLLDAVLELAAYDAEVEVRLTELEALAAGNAEGVATNKTAIEGLVKELADAKKALEDADAELKGALGQDIQKLADRVLQLEAGVNDADWDAIKTLVNDAKDELNESIKKNTEDIAAIKKDIDEVIKEDIKKLQEDVEKISKNLGTMTAAVVNGMITNVVFMQDKKDITFTNYIEKETKFGYDVNGNLLSNYLTFTKDVQRPIAQTFQVRVTPASAVLDASRIAFLNSKGEVMPNVSVTKVVRRENTNQGYISRAAAAPTGIWEVTVQLDNYNQNAFDKATLVNTSQAAGNGNSICYAMSISNPVDENGNARNVTTAYDMTFQYKKYSQQKQLWFNVGGQPVSGLKNRVNYNGTVPNEYTWKRVYDQNRNDITLAYTKEAIEKAAGAGQNTVVADGTNNALENDNRNNRSKNYFSAAYGVPFTVSLTAGDAGLGTATAAHKAAPSAVRAIYVTLDKEFAVESTPSEWEAWNTAFSYSGLNQVVEGTSTQITINSANAVNDIIGFRVYAVNYDGTLVDPDGKAFYVYVGNNAVAQADLTVGVNFASPFTWTAMISEKDPFSTANWGEAGNYEISIKDANGTPVRAYQDLGLTSDNFKFYKNNNGTDADATLLNTSSNNAAGTLTGTLAADKSVVTKVQMINVDPTKLKDGMTYTATITATNGYGVVATGTIKFTKALPAFPSSKVYPFTNVLQNNTLTVYPIQAPNAGNGDKARYEMQNVWHGLTDSEWNNVSGKGQAAKFVQVVTDEQRTAQDQGTYPKIKYPLTAGYQSLWLDKRWVNPNTDVNALYGQSFPMKIVYEYGDIRFALNDAGTDFENKPWSPTGEEFNIVLRNYADDCTFTWNGAAPVLVYNGVQDVQNPPISKIYLDKLIVKDGYNASVDLSGTANGYFQSVEVHFLTGANFDRVDEYYYGIIKPESWTGQYDPSGNRIMDPAHIELTAKSSAAIPGNVPTKLQFVIKDSFGYIIKKVIDVPFTMTPRQ